MTVWQRVTARRAGLAGLAGLVTVALSVTGTVDAHAAVSGVTAAAHQKPAPGKPAQGKPVRGLDISSYQHAGETPAIDWQKLALDGIRFAAIKASEGDYYRNPYYASDVRNASKAGMAVLPYVFANPSKTGGKATAAYALKVVGPGHGREPIVVDLEDDPYAKHAACYGRRGKRIVDDSFLLWLNPQPQSVTVRLPSWADSYSRVVDTAAAEPLATGDVSSSIPLAPWSFVVLRATP